MSESLLFVHHSPAYHLFSTPSLSKRYKEGLSLPSINFVSSSLVFMLHLILHLVTDLVHVNDVRDTFLGVISSSFYLLVSELVRHKATMCLPQETV
jgi:hypothetical protein